MRNWRTVFPTLSALPKMSTSLARVRQPSQTMHQKRDVPTRRHAQEKAGQ